MTLYPPDPAGSTDLVFDDLYQSIVCRHAADVLARLLLHESNPGQLAALASTLANAMSRLIASQRRDPDSGHDDQLLLDTVIDERDAWLTARTRPEGVTA